MNTNNAIAVVGATLLILATLGCSDDVAQLPDSGASDGSSSKEDSQGDAVAHDGAKHEAGAACANPDRPCLLGEAFADCGEASAGLGPKVFCSSAHASCRWVSDGCPITGYEGPYDADCHCVGGGCPSGLDPKKLMMRWGTSAWTREREANLTVISGTGSTGTTVGSLTCDPLPSPWDNPYSPCEGAGAVVVRRLGTLVYEIEPKMPSLVYTTLVVEVDDGTSPATARACLLYYSDLPSCSGGVAPLCAKSGEVTVVSQGGQLAISQVRAVFAGSVKVDVAF
jgi:hypothetical protein